MVNEAQEMGKQDQVTLWEREWWYENTVLLWHVPGKGQNIADSKIIDSTTHSDQLRIEGYFSVFVSFFEFLFYVILRQGFYNELCSLRWAHIGSNLLSSPSQVL